MTAAKPGSVSSAGKSAQSEALAAYVVKGDDPVLVGQAARALIGELTGDAAREMAVEEFGEEDLDVSMVIDACLTLPFLVERRVVVVRDCGRLGAQDVARLCAYLEDPAPTTSLVLVGGAGAFPLKLANGAKKVGHVLDASVGTGQAASKWLADRLRHAPVSLDARAAALVGEHLGQERGRIEGLLEVLAAHHGVGARLGTSEVEPFLGTAGDVLPWELTDAIDRANAAAAIGLARRMMSGGGRHPLALMAILTRHYSNLLRLDGALVHNDAEAGELLGTKSTFVASKARAQAQRLGHDGVARAIGLLADADLDLRGMTAWPAEVVMEVLVARLARLGPRPGAGAAPRPRPTISATPKKLGPTPTS
ncbi:MAG: DNA polymerase III subunit delta [Acidimicrobiales bacterium]